VDIAQVSASELAKHLRDGAVSAVRLLDVLLDRIERLDPAIKAWVTVDIDGSRRVAAERDAEARSGRIRGPLHGVPVGVKDIYHVEGMVTTAGAMAFAHERPATDATAVARLRAAGAVLVGKTATTEFAYRDPAATRNPWNLDHTPGGSSSGSAAAVAARMSPLALGSQTVGSVVRPAGYCGTVGFKPTYGRLSRAGMVPLAWSFDTVGIFCRHTEDAALVFGILAGYDPADLASVDDATLPTSAPAGDGPPSLGVPWRFLESADEEVRRHLEDVVAHAQREGAEVREFEMPSSTGDLAAAGPVVVQAEALAYHMTRFSTPPDDYREQLRAALASAAALSAVGGHQQAQELNQPSDDRPHAAGALAGRRVASATRRR
jgi:aspartyl-tRNA(Asn)/glutamyl-tRNA(Gln) amidotransferase subunit A